MSGNYPPPNTPPNDPPGGGSGAPGGPGGSGPRGPQYQGPGQGGPGQGGPYQGGPGPSQQNPYGPGGQPSYPGSSGTPSGFPPGGHPAGPGGPGGPQQPYGAPQQPYPAYGQGPQGPGGPPPPPPGQPPKKGFPKVLIIVGVLVLALIAGAITLGVVLSRSAPTAGTDPGTGNSSGPGASSAPPPATKPSDAVKAYLEALAAGNAEAAIALGDSAPPETTFLTSEVLAASNKLAPITDINVPEVNDEYAYQVAASFKLGKQAVDENFNVTKAGDQWKLRDAFNEIDLSFRSARNLPTIINGVTAKTSKIRLFPGAYQFTTGTDNVSWGEDSILLIQSPSEYPRGLSNIKATLTDKGEKAFRDAVSASVDKCLKSNKLTNPGCPNSINPKKITSTYKFKDGTIEWEATRQDEGVEDMTVRLEYSNPSVASAYISLGIQAVGECDAPGSQKCTLFPTGALQPRATMVTDPIKLSWT